MQEMNGLLTIENQSKITLSSIESVISLSDTQIVLLGKEGKIRINGSSLKIVGFSSTNGTFSACGRVTEVKYMPKADKISSLFK